MAQFYTPRRFGQRWRDATTPPEVLDILRQKDDPKCWDVLLWSPAFCGASLPFRKTFVFGLDVGPEGRASFELAAYQAINYRYHNKNRRTRWADLPESVRQMVIDWIKED